MALDGTYAGLTASIQSWMNRADLAGDPIGDAVVIGEARINRLLRHRLMLTQASIAVSTASFALPAGFLQPNLVTLDTGQQLESATPEAMAQKVYVDGPGSGPPLYYTVLGAEMQLYPAPAPSANVELLYYAALSPANPSGNWLLSAYPDIYLSAGLYGALTYTQDDRAAAFDALLQRQIQELNIAHEGLGARLAPHAGAVI
jgi:hypothetical protein